MTKDEELIEREYRKTATIRATQWHKMGDHPAVLDVLNPVDNSRRFWIDTLEGGHIVTPGDWIATSVKGEHWPIKPDVFAASYVEALAQPVVGDEWREQAISAAYLAIYGEGMDPHEHPEGWEYASTIADAILSLSTPVVGGGWSPIDQAPRNGESMLGWSSGCGYDVVRINSDGKCYAGAFNADWVKFVRPLPEPPAPDPHTMDRAGMAQEVDDV